VNSVTYVAVVVVHADVDDDDDQGDPHYFYDF
jgi:hypothetical protein